MKAHISTLLPLHDVTQAVYNQILLLVVSPVQFMSQMLRRCGGKMGNSILPRQMIAGLGSRLYCCHLVVSRLARAATGWRQLLSRRKQNKTSCSGWSMRIWLAFSCTACTHLPGSRRTGRLQMLCTPDGSECGQLQVSNDA